MTVVEIPNAEMLTSRRGLMFVVLVDTAGKLTVSSDS